MRVCEDARPGSRVFVFFFAGWCRGLDEAEGALLTAFNRTRTRTRARKHITTHTTHPHMGAHPDLHTVDWRHKLVDARFTHTNRTYTRKGAQNPAHTNFPSLPTHKHNHTPTGNTLTKDCATCFAVGVFFDAGDSALILLARLL